MIFILKNNNFYSQMEPKLLLSSSCVKQLTVNPKYKCETDHNLVLDKTF